MLGMSHNVALRRVSAFVNAAVVLITLIGVFIGVNRNQMPSGLSDFLAMRITIKNLLVTSVVLVGGAISFHLFGLTAPPATDLRNEIVRIIKACTVACVFAALFPVTSHSGAFTPRIALYFLPTAIVACICGRLVARVCTMPLTTALAGRRDVIIVGSGPGAARLLRRLEDDGGGNAVRVLGFVDSDNFSPVAEEIRPQIIGTIADLESLLMRIAVDQVLIALPADTCFPQIQYAISVCEQAGVETKYFFSDMFELSVAKPAFERDENSSVVRLKVVHDDARLIVKRAIDIAAAAVGLVVLAPLMLLIVLAIKLTGPGPVIFVQERYGFRKRLFRMYKFRTMVPEAETLQKQLEAHNEVSGPVFKIRNDPRITPLGRFLRKTSLDELPQLMNVLRGDMSLVGPRPLPQRDVSRFDNAALMRRFSVKPGLTCLWQIAGRSNTNFDRWIELDLRYIDTWSLSLDLVILAKTVPTVLAGRGAS